MVLDFALLADSVMTRPDGKLDLHGAGFDTVYATAVPATHPRLVLALRFRLSAAEAVEPHRMAVVIRDVHGKQIAATQAEQPAAKPEALKSLPPDAEAGLGILLSFEGLVFEEYGRYELTVSWDGDLVRALPILVVEPPGASP